MVKRIETEVYMIRAILREEQRKKTPIEIQDRGKRIQANALTLKAINFTCTTVSPLASWDVHRFILHSDIGVISFLANRLPEENQGKHNEYHFAFPQSLAISQRRMHQRLKLPHRENFRCCGRYHNGYNYSFTIHDLSCSGCSLIGNPPDNMDASRYRVLKNAVLHLGEYGDIVIDIEVKNIIEIAPKAADTGGHLYRLGCQFFFKDSRNKNKLEQKIMKIIVDEKTCSKKLYN